MGMQTRSSATTQSRHQLHILIQYVKGRMAKHRVYSCLWPNS